ncbi:hypothetical protein R1flu_017287 [Riccia fluitans]|uniref:RING-type E3 ubiquitin transferase n=1 Tax=Riccia fluitans TaxID=41844 RepID=A0ABD1XDS9_9MARC
MVMETPEIVMVRALLAKIKGIPILRSECRLLVEILSGLLPVLKEMSSPQARISDMTRGVDRVDVRLAAGGEGVGENQTCFNFKTEAHEEIRQLKSRLEDLGKDLSDAGSSRDEDDENDFLAEVMEVLRAHSNGDAATTSVEGGKAMDGLLQLLARRLNSDVATVLSEWQEVKEETRRLQEKVEYTAENKRRMDRDLMEVLRALDSGIQQGQATRSEGEVSERTEAAATSSTSDTSPAQEFLCAVCRNLMEDPVVCASGHSYCRECLMKWFQNGNNICPLSNTRVPPEVYPNFVLRNLIIRWTEDTTRRPHQCQDVQVSVEPPPRLTIEVPLESVDEPANSRRTFSPNVPEIRSFSPPSTPSVAPLIAFLKSQSSNLTKIRSNLKELASLALDPCRQWEIYSADGIFVIARYLSSEDASVAEKAAEVFENLAFKPKKGNDHLRYDQREEILTSVVDFALDSLINQLQFGNPSTRFVAARAVVYLLEDDQAWERVRRKEGVVRGLFGLENTCTRALLESSQEGINLCKKGLALLAGYKPPAASPNTNRDLSTALLRLLVSPTTNRKLVEETLEVLSFMVKRAGYRNSHTLLDRDGIHVLIGLFHPPESLSAHGRTFSKPNSLTEGGKREILTIFDEISKSEGLLHLIECDLIKHLLGTITDPEAGKDFVSLGVKLLWKCIQGSVSEFSPVTHFHCDFQLEMKGVVDILRRDQIPDESKLDLLSVLVHLCDWRSGNPLRESFFRTSESFLNTGGVAALGVLAKSPLEVVREKTGVQLRLIAESYPCHRELRTPEAAVLLATLLADEVEKCRCEAVVALASVAKAGNWEMLLEGVTIEQVEVVPVERVVNTLFTTSSSDCREASISVLGKISQKHSGAPGNSKLSAVLREKRTIKGLLDIVRLPAGGDVEAEAAELLMNLVEQDHNICAFLVEENEDGLSVLIKFGVQSGSRLRPKVVKLLQAFAEVSVDTKGALMDVGGVPLLVEAVEEGKNKNKNSCNVSVASDAIKALKSLINYGPAQGAVIDAGFAKEAVIEAGFAETAIECLSVRPLSHGLLGLFSSILDREATAEKKKATAERIRKARGVQALVRVLSVRNAGLEEKNLVAAILTRLIQLDQGVQPILREEKGMEHLNNLLKKQADEANQSNRSSCCAEVLKTLIAATEDSQSLELLLKEQCIEPLLSLLSESSVSDVEGLALDLLLKLSRGALTSGSSADFKVPLVSKCVLRIMDTSVDDNLVECAARIIRNISLFGPAERKIMCTGDRGAVNVLLRTIRTCQAEAPSNDVNFSIIALERFMLEDEGRKSFLQEEGIPRLVNFLGKSRGQAKLFATRILVMLASEHNPKEWFTKTWNLKEDLLLSLRENLESGDTDCKIQATELLKCLILKGRGAEVCRYISDTGCHSKLRDLQTDAECGRYASEALDAYNRHKKDNRHGSRLWSR